MTQCSQSQQTPLPLQQPHHPAGYLGRHLLAEFYECNPNILNNCELIEEQMQQAALACGATIVQSNFHTFSPYGVSGVVIIAESHLAIHTWPEFGYAAVDLFTCGETCDPKVAYEFLKNAFRAGSAHYSELKRGELDKQNHVKHTPFQVKTESHFDSTQSANAQPTLIGAEAR